MIPHFLNWNILFKPWTDFENIYEKKSKKFLWASKDLEKYLFPDLGSFTIPKRITWLK